MENRIPTILVIAGVVVTVAGMAWSLQTPGDSTLASLQVGLLSESLAQVGGLPGCLHEGDLISAAGSDDPDIYIVNEQGFKRLFLNPALVGVYGHLGGFANVKSVTPQVRDAYRTSGLFRNCETNDEKVYGVVVSGEDTGTLHWVNVAGTQAVAQAPDFFRKVFCINTNEFSWYPQGSTFTSVSQVPDYSRTATPTPSAAVSPSPTPPPSLTPGVGGPPDAFSPVARIVGDEQSVIAARFKFTASIDNFKISRLNLEMPDASGTSEVRLWHEGTRGGVVPAQTGMTLYISTFDQFI